MFLELKNQQEVFIVSTALCELKQICCSQLDNPELKSDRLRIIKIINLLIPRVESLNSN